MFWNLLVYVMFLVPDIAIIGATFAAAYCRSEVAERTFDQIGIFEQLPEHFDSTVQVSACVVRAGDRILALQRGSHKHDPGKWEVPGGKFLEGETLNSCAARELFEETGIEQNRFQEVGVLYVRRVEGDFTLHVVLTELHDPPNVVISREHCSYQWVTTDEMRNLDLIKGEELLIDLYLRTVAVERGDK